MFIAMVSSVVFVIGVLGGYSPFTAFRPVATELPLGDRAPCMEIGMSGNAEWDKFSPSEYALAADTTRDLGIGRVRIGANWGEIERTRGAHDWSALDMRVRTARDAGLAPLLVIQTMPAWLSIPTGPITGEHREVASMFGDFAGMVAARYGTAVDSYEIWNEPNLHKFWPNPDVSHYAELLKAAYPAIHAADGRATVITAGLAPAPDSGNTIAPMTFLRKLYDLGAREYFDAIGMHPYSYPEMPSGQSDWNTFRSLEEVSALMAAQGDASKKIWLTEYGAPTGGSSRVSFESQAAMVVEAFQLARANGSLGPIFIYTLIDGGAAQQDPEFHFGLYYADMSPKPAVGALQQVLAGCASPGGGSSDPGPFPVEDGSGGGVSKPGQVPVDDGAGKRSGGGLFGS